PLPLHDALPISFRPPRCRHHTFTIPPIYYTQKCSFVRRRESQIALRCIIICELNPDRSISGESLNHYSTPASAFIAACHCQLDGGLSLVGCRLSGGDHLGHVVIVAGARIPADAARLTAASRRYGRDFADRAGGCAGEAAD